MHIPKIRVGSLLLIGLLASLAARAEPPGAYDALVDAVDFGGVSAAVMTVAGLVVAVLVAIRAVRFIYGIVRR